MENKITDIVERLGLNISQELAEKFAEEIIDECMFAFLVSYNGKINPITLKELIDEQLGIKHD